MTWFCPIVRHLPTSCVFVAFVVVVFVLLSVSTLSSATLKFVGDSHTFPPFKRQPADPIFQFLPNGAKDWVNYAVGTAKRPGCPDNLNIVAGTNENGGKGCGGECFFSFFFFECER